MSMNREENTAELLHSVRGVLRYHKTCNMESYPAEPDLVAFIERSPSSPVLSPASETVQAPPATETAPVLQKKNVDSNQKELSEIIEDIVSCKSCALHKERTCVVAGKGSGQRIRLMIIGLWLKSDGETKEMFGQAEDLMLARMLAAIHLPPEDVYVTNAVKCGLPATIEPQSEHFEACSSFLVRQIRAVAPELICCMGTKSTRVLLKDTQPLARLRGRFHNYQGMDGVTVPVMPTFHPGYLLKNPEMKNATWQDLQIIERRLRALKGEH